MHHLDGRKALPRQLGHRLYRLQEDAHVLVTRRLGVIAVRSAHRHGRGRRRVCCALRAAGVRGGGGGGGAAWQRCWRRC